MTKAAGQQPVRAARSSDLCGARMWHYTGQGAFLSPLARLGLPVVGLLHSRHLFDAAVATPVGVCLPPSCARCSFRYTFASRRITHNLFV